jgi:hypothetical protein
MRSYERSGVTVDQCSECRGIFLDRGELERLVDAENSWHSSPQQHSPQQHSPQQHSAGRPPQTYPQAQQGYPYKKKRKSFLDELFD